MADRKKEEYWVGFDLGGTKMLAVVFDADFKPVARRRRKTKGYQGTQSGLGRMVETIEQALEEAGVKAAKLSGIGVGAPGPLDMVAGTIPRTPNLGWRNAKVKASLEEAFGCSVAVANDVDAGVYGEYCFGAAKGERCVVGLFPGTGIGGGCVYEGRIVRGAKMSCVEIGHIPVQPDGPLCGCGQRGCLEAVASRLAISSAAAVAAYRGLAPHLLETVGMDLSNIRSSVLAESISQGDTAVEAIVRDAARWLGVGVAAVVNILLPDVVLLGGGLVEEMPDLFRTEVENTARGRVMQAFRKTFKVKVAELGDDASVTGAAAWAREVIQAGRQA